MQLEIKKKLFLTLFNPPGREEIGHYWSMG
jgi:hypothetical protein